jgi:hypothetical protein
MANISFVKKESISAARNPVFQLLILFTEKSKPAME